MTFTDAFNADVRLTILQILNKDPGYSVNHELMAAALDHTRAYSLTDDQVKTHFQWLADQGLVTTETVDRFNKAKLTDLGKRAAGGRVAIPGVARPNPSDTA